jgi:GT2 family glycosyltransferase
VVLATRNRRHLLRSFVSAVAADPAATEVLVVLDGDVDGSYAEVEELRREFPKVRPIAAAPGGQMKSLDVGVQYSTGDVVLLMDDDVIAGPGLVSAHARCHAGTEGLVVVGSMPVRLDEGSSPPTRLYASEYDEHCRRLESGELAVLDGLWLGNVSARRSDLLRVGVASDDFAVRWHADTDFGLRLQAAGARGVFDPALAATHMHAQSTPAFLASAHERGEGTWLLETQHADRISAARPAPVFDGLSAPTRALISFFGHERRSGWSSRAVMAAGRGAERLGAPGVSVKAAQLARRVQVACGYRCAARRNAKGPGAPGAPVAVSVRPTDEASYASSSTKSGS